MPPEASGDGRAPAADRVLAGCTLLAFALWLACVGPVRTWASGWGVREAWALGVAPSFFAGATLALWQSLATGARAVASVVVAVVLVALAEAAQVLHPRSTADLWDVAAGTVGALLAAPVVVWRRGGPEASGARGRA